MTKYEAEKQKIIEMNLSASEYEKAIKDLIDRIGV